MNPASSQQLLDALVLAVQRMPAGQVVSLAAVVAEHPRFTPDVMGHVLGAVANPTYRYNAEEVLKVWAITPDTPGVAVALALRAAAAAREHAHGEQSLEIVWTGPSSFEVPV